MAVGEGTLEAELSYVAIGRETVLGTYNTATANLDFLTFAPKISQERKMIEQIERSRTHSKSILLGKKIEGSIEGYFYADLTACVFILQQAMGGSLTSATITGETAGGFTHTFETGSMDNSFTSLCINTRKGQVTAGQVYEYSGVRVNELTFSAEIDDALKFNAGVMAFDATLTSNDVESALTISAHEPLNFVGSRFSAETTFASLTSTSFWEVQSIEAGIQNNLKGDNESRRLGSAILQVLPPGIAQFPITTTIRFDTTTAVDAMVAGTQLSLELDFLGTTISGSAFARSLLLRFPKVFVMDSGDPEISGPGGQLTSEVTFMVLRDDSSATGFAMQAVLTNGTANYT